MVIYLFLFLVFLEFWYIKYIGNKVGRVYLLRYNLDKLIIILFVKDDFNLYLFFVVFWILNFIFLVVINDINIIINYY